MINLGFFYKMTNAEYGYNLVADVKKKLMAKKVYLGISPSLVHNTREKLGEGNAEIVSKEKKH